ncbi:MAG TPA: beta-propeller domain-containing protein, partial [Miltoncostaeaceae bacterium]|nr:beta-propeller domain-containing protein [Miltoncostaeaceae bacterium]
MRRGAVALGAAGAALIGAAAWAGSGGDAEARRPAPAVAAAPEARAAGAARKADRLRNFATCDALTRHAAARAAALVTPHGVGGYDVAWRGRAGSPEMTATPVPATAGAPAADSAAAPVEGVDHSGTNVQEAGVDEPDIVKTYGRHVFTVAGGVLRAVRVGDDPREAGRLDLGEDAGEALLLREG